VRVYHKPFIRWIWLGALFMMTGGLLAASNKRYRRKIRAEKAAEQITEEVPA
jgi:cytochrome c-type biogenesis protein CcmF